MCILSFVYYMMLGSSQMRSISDSSRRRLSCLSQAHCLTHQSHCFFSVGFCLHCALSGNRVEISSVIGVQNPIIALSDAKQAARHAVRNQCLEFLLAQGFKFARQVLASGRATFEMVHDFDEIRYTRSSVRVVGNEGQGVCNG